MNTIREAALAIQGQERDGYIEVKDEQLDSACHHSAFDTSSGLMAGTGVQVPWPKYAELDVGIWPGNRVESVQPSVITEGHDRIVKVYGQYFQKSDLMTCRYGNSVSMKIDWVS